MSRTTTSHVLLAIISFIWSWALLSQDHIQFKSYTINDGLSQSYVSCIVQDQLGALWVGTQDGINRFNGNNFDVFTADQGYDISNEYILTAKKDESGNLWFGTYDGLIRYNLNAEKFSSFLLPHNKRIEIRALEIDNQGNVWIGTAFGDLYKFDHKKELFELKDSSFNTAIKAINVDKDQVLVVSEYEGLLVANKDFTKKEKHAISVPEMDKNIMVNSLLKHPKDKTLLATNFGVFEFIKETKQFKPFKKNVFDQLGGINIIDVLFISTNRFFVATESAGLYQIEINESKESIINYVADFFQKNTLLSDKINKVYQDKKGNIWIASQRGLNSFDPYNTGFRGVGFSGNPKKGLASQNVWGFHEDPTGAFLFVAGDHGLTRFDRENHHYTHYNRTTHKSEDFTTLGVYVIDKNNALAASFDGLYHLKINEEAPNDFTYTEIKHTIDDQRGFDKTYKIVPYKEEGVYLIGTKAGLAVYDMNKNTFEYFYHEPSEPQSIGVGPVRLVYKSIENRFFLSPSSGGIYEFVGNAEEGYSISKPEAFSLLYEHTKDYFTSMNQTSKAEFWLGTMGDGLYYLNINSGEIKHFNKESGLPNNVIYGIEKSPNKKILWLSTNRGIVKFNRTNETFTTFSEADGLMSDELNLGASFTSKNGEIYFGGIQGYNYFDPSKPLTRTSNLNVYFSRIEIENEKITPEQSSFLNQSISFTKNLELPYNQRSLNLFFFADDLSNPDRIEYKYVLKGDDEIEELLGSSNQLRFTSLAPGRYELEVYARNYNASSWNNTPAKLTITVEKPFWLTWWFYAVLLGVIGLIILQRVRQSIDKERRQQVRLELKIAERTKEIRAKTEKIESQKQKLEDQKLELEKEKEKSERLLNNLLPKETASQLKNDGRSAARDFNMVSVMFTDFVGFTGIAENMNAKDLVNILDKYFRKFDEIIEEYDLEKIKTIGDAYMCAGGVPIRNKTNPINTLLAAVKIQDYMQQEKELAQDKGEFYWKLRIGINTGPVSAGVIGTKKYAYDVWGRTVNRAQRMERMCTPEKIAITEDTFEHIEPYFECEPKGKVKTKSGLEIMMYEVHSIKPELSKDGKGIEPNDAFEKLVTLHFFSKINYYKAERYILAKLKKELSDKLHYHSYDHSKDVTRQAERIAIAEGITDEDLFVLKTAATYHDAGFVKQYDKNEPVGAEMAQEILPNFGYTQTHIDRIKELIFVTQIPHQPKNKLEEIICDADLDYLGRDDFHEIADKLRQELREHGKIDSDRQWDQIQVSFLTQHRFFTRTAIETRKAKKMQNLEDIKERLQRDQYKD